MYKITHILTASNANVTNLVHTVYTLCYHLPEYTHEVIIDDVIEPSLLYYLQFAGASVYIVDKDINSYKDFDIAINYYEYKCEADTTILFNTPIEVKSNANVKRVDDKLARELELAIGDYLFRLKHIKGNRNIILNGDVTLDNDNTIRLDIDPRIKYRQLLSSKAYITDSRIDRTVLEAAALKIPIIAKHDTEVDRLFKGSVLVYRNQDEIASLLNNGLVDNDRISSASIVAKQHNMRIFINEFKTYLQ